MFSDRKDAGRQLAAELGRRGLRPEFVLGIPRGGVAVAWEVAKALGCEFGILVVRKLPFPDNPEAGFGAVAEDGSLCLLPGVTARLPRCIIKEILDEQFAEAQRRARVLRRREPLPEVRGREILLVDDGIAMGSTVLAAVRYCRRRAARRVTVAAPVASPEARARLVKSADDVVTLLSPGDFMAVASYYEKWYDVPDQEVVAILEQARRRAATG